jgi:hypothetical protein
MNSQYDLSSKQAQNENKFTYSHQEIMKIIQLQRHIRSKTRRRVHKKYFAEEPCTTVKPLKLPAQYQSLADRLNTIIAELSNHHAVINGAQFNHFTNLTNLKSIIREGYLLGNSTLKRKQISFKKNALDDILDKSDKDTICFAPARVDAIALVENRKFKKDLCAIICDVTTVNYPGYNQFFKLSDFCCQRYQYIVDINSNCSIEVRKHDQYTINIKLSVYNTKKIFLFYSFITENHSLLFYGSLHNINQFCLQWIFNNMRDKNCYNELFDYFQSLNNAELKKTLLIIAQSITCFSEYNVHGYLNLDDIRIKEIRLFGSNIKYDLTSLNADEYKLFLNNFADNQWQDPLVKRCEKPLERLELLNDDEAQSKFLPSSVIMNTSKVHIRLTDVSATLFASNQYLETRAYVNRSGHLSKIVCRNH